LIIQLSESCPILVSDQAVPQLHRLLYSITIHQWHTIAIPSPDRLKKIVPAHVWEVYGTFLVQAFKRSVNSSETVAFHSDCGSCDPVKIADYYSLPLVLIVENITTDGALVGLVANKLRPRLARKMTGKHPALAFHQAGGIGEVPKSIRRLALIYDRARPDKDLPLRVVVLTDSDAKTPGQESDFRM
jgi:hypothetical protein